MAYKPDDSKTEEPHATQVEWLADAQDATSQEHDMTLLSALRRYPKPALWSLAMSSTIIMEGYDTMLMGNLYAQPAFQRRYGVHVEGDSYEIPSAWQAGLGNGSACGQLIGLLLARYVSERFGFRKTMVLGLSAIIGLIFITFFAPSLAVLEVGQVLFGIPLGLFQTTPIVWFWPSILIPILFFAPESP
ncbi:hypothetical protein CEP53_014717 [Fusarium sp. AF-6]|nr:hypothetical protein CEP53_014717 [Fusarium sp. AF-6]